MKPVFQTKLHSDTVRGNCYAACLASILEITIEEVPAFEDMDDGDWWDATQSWLRENFGYQIRADDSGATPNGHVIACGPSPRGNFGHSVIYRDGTLAHDPHPSGAGIKSLNYYLVIESVPII